MNTYTRKIGQNRGKPRLWLEGQILNLNGFPHGMRFDIINEKNTLIITANIDGKRKIAGKPGREIIDMSAGTITASFDSSVKTVTIVTTQGKLMITGNK